MQLSKAHYLKARDFILTNARMIERRLFHYHFEQGDTTGVFHAVYAYRIQTVDLATGWNPIRLRPRVNPFLPSWH